LNDGNQQVIVVLDATLKRYNRLKFHPNINTETVTISYGDLEKFIQWRGNKQIGINL
jgi:Ala-tRNA(Pro) deacylase